MREVRSEVATTEVELTKLVVLGCGVVEKVQNMDSITVGRNAPAVNIDGFLGLHLQSTSACYVDKPKVIKERHSSARTVYHKFRINILRFGHLFSD